MVAIPLDILHSDTLCTTSFLFSPQDTTSSSSEEEVEHLPVYSADQLSTFDAEECRKNIANMENQKNK